LGQGLCICLQIHGQNGCQNCQKSAVELAKNIGKDQGGNTDTLSVSRLANRRNLSGDATGVIGERGGF
jgi:hypothetical protein